MALEDEQIEAWMIECRGGFAVNLSATEKLAFSEVLGGEDVTADMLVTDKANMTEESARDIWSVILSEVEKLIIKSVGRALSPIRMAKLLAWCVAPTAVMTGGASPLEALSQAAETLAAAEASAAGRAGATAGRKVASDESSVQFADTIPAGPEEKQDMEAQGASRSSQLCWFRCISAHSWEGWPD